MDVASNGAADVEGVFAMTKFLDERERVCVMSADTIKSLSTL